MSEMMEKSAAKTPQDQAPSMYWRTLSEWTQDDEFWKAADTEFESSPLRGSAEEGWARREFLKLMGASIAMASTACVRRPVEKIVPYNRQPEEVTFAVANHYSSAWFDGSEAVGLLVKTREGRPVKVEGHPQNPFTQGGMSARGQAHILNLYDPERLQGPKRNLQNKERTNRDTVNVTWEDADKAIVTQLQKGGVAVLTGAISSPTTRELVQDFCQGFKARHVEWELLNQDDVREGQRASYGEALVPQMRFDLAKTIVSVDADFLGTWIAPTAQTRGFSQGRRKMDAGMNRLIVFESAYSLTGANADLRVRIKPSQQVDVLMGLAHEIVVKKGQSKFAGNAMVKSALAGFADAAKRLGVTDEQWSFVANSLWEQRGQSLVVAGGPAAQTEWYLQTQIACNFLNSLLENEGKTVGRGGPGGLRASSASLLELVESMEKGQVKTLICHGINPVYILGSAIAFEEKLKKVEMVVSTADRLDESSVFAHYVLPDNHSMETWGDVEFADGVYGIQQPTIRPLYDTRSFQLSLMTWAYEAKVGSEKIRKFETFFDYLQNSWKEKYYPKFGAGLSFEEFWDQVLDNGSVGKAQSPGARSFRLESLSGVKASDAGKTGLELVLFAQIGQGDGRLANVSWLNELPDPITKLVWDNTLLLSFKLAEDLGLKMGDLVQVTTDAGQSLNVPVLTQPGLHDEVAALALGFGRTRVGKVGNGVGVNASKLLKVSSKTKALVFSGHKIEIKKLGKNIPLAITGGHHTMSGRKEGERKIVVEATLEEYLKDKSANNHNHKIFSLWSGHQFNGNKWAMAVDLNSCTGCSACVVACQSENNISVVGKEYVLQGREMHWLRVDRYFVGDPSNAETVFQPVMCQHCDNAPCETVCPVLATVHSSEGLNDMIYNRCVGTRYCANNCPYKVRRFNWFNFTKNIEKPLHLALNPEVTVRPRGVMEKCTFCVHRIHSAKNKARQEQRSIQDGEVKTACQQSCPTDAIVFGDVNDPNSQVSKMFKEDPRGYALLEEFNAAPSVRYFTKIRNNGQAHRKPQKDQHKGGHA